MGMPEPPPGFTIVGDPMAGAPPPPPGFVIGEPALPDVASFGDDPKVAKAAIDKLPEPMRPIARDKWADAVIAKERTKERGDVGMLQTIGDINSRVMRGLTMGGSDELGAMLRSTLGGTDYEMEHALERARERAVKGASTTIATLPVIGDVTTGGIVEAAGSVAGALVSPAARIMAGTGAVPTAVNAGVTGLGYGAAGGALSAEPGARTEGAVMGGVVGGGLGAALGGLAGRLLNPREPNAANVPSNLTGRTVAEASDNLALPVPHSVAGGPTEQRVAQGLKQVPGAGRPITTAEGQLFEGVARTADNIADAYAPGVAGRGLEPEAAGTFVRDSIENWIRGDHGGSRAALARLYDPVDQLMAATPTRGRRPNVYPLTQTENVAIQLAQRGWRGTVPDFEPLLARLDEAFQRRGGLEWQGMRDLRTSLRHLIDDRVTPLNPTQNAGATQLYDALTADLRVGLMAADRARGGRAALPLWERANNAAAIAAERREQLANIIGARGDRSGTDVLDRIIRLAGSTSAADTGRLRIAMAAMGPQGREAVASAAIHRLGRNQSDEFTMAAFLKNYSARSDRGKDLLFGQIGGPGPRGNLRQQLDDLQTIIEQIQRAGQLRNTSNTAGTSLVGGTLIGVAGGTLGIAGALKAALAGYGMARVLARPVRVQNLNTGLQQIRNALTMGGTRMDEGIMRGINTIATTIAEETQEDPAAVQRRLERSLRGR